MTREQRYRIGRLKTYFEVEHPPTATSEPEERCDAWIAQLLATHPVAERMSDQSVEWLDRTWERVFGPAPQWQLAEEQEA